MNPFRSKDGRVVIAQKPNALILIWVFAFAGSLLTAGQPRTAFSLVATVALIVWALLELISGVNLFRRLLGAAVLMLSIISLYRLI